MKKEKFINNKQDKRWIIDSFKSYLERKNLKYTKQRENILFTILENDQHMSAEEISNLVRKKYPQCGLATVYRTLVHLYKAKVINKYNFSEDKVLYELKEPNRHHDHFFCVKCNHIIEEFSSKDIEEIYKNLAKKVNFKLFNHHAVLFGSCKNCQ